MKQRKLIRIDNRHFLVYKYRSIIFKFVIKKYGHSYYFLIKWNSIHSHELAYWLVRGLFSCLRGRYHEEKFKELSKLLSSYFFVFVHHGDGHFVVDNWIIVAKESKEEVNDLVDHAWWGTDRLTNRFEVKVEVTVVENVDSVDHNIEIFLTSIDVETYFRASSLSFLC